MSGCSGSRPINLGVTQNQLSACPDRPNCVNSFASVDDEHYVAPLEIQGDAAATWQKLQDVIKQTERSEIIKSEPTYIYAEYTTKLMRFVDDVEFLLQPEAGKIQVRSASRLGYRDFGVNRERIEAIRAELQGQ
ncbi:MAG: DUF1499 domain-containing protein [Hahellaceae bacterium]|nr:DUF1499 domain-containing protein [Hahellaceae bacterium]